MLSHQNLLDHDPCGTVLQTLEKSAKYHRVSLPSNSQLTKFVFLSHKSTTNISGARGQQCLRTRYIYFPCNFIVLNEQTYRKKLTWKNNVMQTRVWNQNDESKTFNWQQYHATVYIRVFHRTAHMKRYRLKQTVLQFKILRMFLWTQYASNEG